MKKFITNIAIAAGLLLGVSSCDGFLDKVPTDSVVAESAMVTMDDAKVAANGLYIDLMYYNMYGTYMVYMGDMRADNLYPLDMGGTGSTVYQLDFSPTQTNYFGFWQNYYNIIMKANTFIANINTLETISTAEEDLKNDLTGQAYAIRSLCYFDLARLYGYPYLKDNGASLGAIILTSVVSPSEARLPRNTVAETYAQAESDVQTALGLLSKSKNDGHFNYWAAKMLQGKIALYKGDYKTAYEACSEVVEESPYRLVPNEEYLNYWSKVCDDESVMEFLVTADGDIDSDGGFYTIYHNLWFEASNAGKSVIPTKKWRELFKDTPNDVRAQMIKYNDPETGIIKDRGFYWLKKFIGNEGGTTFRQNNPRLFRITDAYLMAAEAALELGGHQDIADDYLNAVRKRADLTAEDVTATLDLIATERHKEFIGEGHRFFDVMRKGGSIVRDQSIDENDFAGSPREVITWDDHRVVLPISDTERSIHPELQQNPGY